MWKANDKRLLGTLFGRVYALLMGLAQFVLGLSIVFSLSHG